MLKYCDSFDHATWTALQALGYTTSRGEAMSIVPAIGRWGTSVLRLNYYHSVAVYPPMGTRLCNRIVIGFACKATGQPLRVFFRSGTYLNFTVTMTISATGMTFSYVTGPGTGYPVIPNSPYVSVPFIGVAGHYTYIELYVDVTDYTNGTVKVAVNGKTVHTLTGIMTAAGLGFGNDPFDSRAKLTNVGFGEPNDYTDYCYDIDSIYICDDEGGYHNDFLGDIFVKTFYPVGDGDKIDWSPYINGLAAPGNTQRVTLIDDPVFDPAVEPDYIQADQDLSQETMSFGPALIPAESTLIAVNHRTAARSVASPGTPPQNTLIPLYKSQGNDIIVANSLAKKFTGWTYKFLDVYWNLVEGLTVDWTKLLLAESQFGFMLRESIWTGVILEELGFADEVVDE